MTGEAEALLEVQPEHGPTPPAVVTKFTERQALEHPGVVVEAPEGDADPTKDQVLRDAPILDDAKEDPGDHILWQQHQQEHRGTAISHRLALLRLILLRDEEALLPSVSQEAEKSNQLGGTVISHRLRAALTSNTEPPPRALNRPVTLHVHENRNLIFDLYHMLHFPDVLHFNGTC